MSNDNKKKQHDIIVSYGKEWENKQILPLQVVKGNTKKTVNSHSFLGSGEKPLPGCSCRTRIMSLQGNPSHAKITTQCITRDVIID